VDQNCAQHSLDNTPLQGTTAQVLSVAKVSQTTETTFNRQQFCSCVEAAWKDLEHCRNLHCWTRAVCLSCIWTKEWDKCTCTQKADIDERGWYRKWWTKGEVQHMDMGDLPLCKFVLFQHIKRPTYQTRIYKLAHKAYPVLPYSCEGHGCARIMICWNLSAWSEKEIMPRTLVDILES